MAANDTASVVSKWGGEEGSGDMPALCETWIAAIRQRTAAMDHMPKAVLATLFPCSGAASGASARAKDAKGIEGAEKTACYMLSDDVRRTGYCFACNMLEAHEDVQVGCGCPCDSVWNTDGMASSAVEYAQLLCSAGARSFVCTRSADAYKARSGGAACSHYVAFPPCPLGDACENAHTPWHASAAARTTAFDAALALLSTY